MKKKINCLICGIEKPEGENWRKKCLPCTPKYNSKTTTILYNKRKQAWNRLTDEEQISTISEAIKDLGDSSIEHHQAIRMKNAYNRAFALVEKEKRRKMGNNENKIKE